ncbi:hypothetical protein JXB27_03920 [Candidatus Woesearchaeota archaeon]|nr:hypothetical protein [Candidatus Woesearchaeota archaeon]
MKTLFPLEKILHISLKEYCEHVGKPSNVYDLFGVHSTSLPVLSEEEKETQGNAAVKDEYAKIQYEFEKFRANVPENAEVVVAFKHDVASVAARNTNGLTSVNGKALVEWQEYYYGVALIPKKKKSQ